MAQETFNQWLQKSSPSISGFDIMTVTELLYKFEQYIQEHAVKGDTGRGIQNIVFEKLSEEETITTFSAIITYDTGGTYEFQFTLPNGVKGDTGNGIKDISFIESHDEGNLRVNTFVIEYTKSESKTVTVNVKNGTRISRIYAGIPYDDGYGNTKTPITFEYEDFTSPLNVEVTAKNGSGVLWSNIISTNLTQIKRGNFLFISSTFDKIRKGILNRFRANMMIKPTGTENEVLYTLNLENISNRFNSYQGVLVPANDNDLTKSYGIYFAKAEINIDEDNNQANFNLIIIDRYGNLLSSENFYLDTFINFEVLYNA